ncbi:MAG: citrate synthase [Bdellovibrionaceae bacterium]|nr:citrate synthase [Pseudobdellovibrionaceae bacterium]|tara:strand:+ start:27026 stop:28159 length:1134 start_codon:yes stop_codon:yes gene_type:complete
MSQTYEGALDRGLEGVVACSTGISSIVDATLCYRGYTIDQLAEHSTFEETVFLLWNDRLPTASELEAFSKDLKAEMKVDAAAMEVISKLPTENVHPMAWLRSAVSILAHYDSTAQDDSKEANLKKGIMLTAKLGTLVAAFQRIRTGKPVVEPKADQSIAWNFMYMLNGEEPKAEIVKVMDTCLILHADHELNCSAFAARVTASSLSDIYSSVVSAIGALKGPLHGGANEQVMLMLKDIGTEEKAGEWVKDALARKEKIMGFGHRVYKNGDPRARILRSISKEVTEASPEPHWFKMSVLIDDTVQNEKGLLPNVDFYSATVYYSMGIPIDIYTPIFAMSRVSGWLAHMYEQWENNRIYRPRGKWVGKEGLTYKPISER